MTKEIENVLKLDKEKQYEYFLKKVADWELIWSLKNEEGWVTSGEGEKEFFPIWPQKEFAELCIEDVWEDCYAESIDLEEFMEKWLGGLAADNIEIVLMWYDDKGINVHWEQLKADIEDELENY